MLTILPNKNLSLQGKLQVPGDKSITHRALILAAISINKVYLKGWLQSLDCFATLNALRQLGITAVELDNETLYIKGVGLYGLHPSKPNNIIDVGNSGTSLRLLTGILAAQNFDSIITGDDSLRKRPMARIIEPLNKMGARIKANNNNFAPLIIKGSTLKGITYTMPIASSQVKSSLLLAGLYASGKTLIYEPIVCRDHTEKMLTIFKKFKTNPAKTIHLDIPGDLSSAAFFIIGATIATGSNLMISSVGLNPTRTGVIDILNKMGANIAIKNQHVINCEVRADLYITSSKLHGIKISGTIIPRAIDELPIIFIAAACADGVTYITDATELRYKESDRIATMAQGLINLGIKVNTYHDGLEIYGGKITGGIVDAAGDHRVAMAFAMASLVASQPIIINNANHIATSFPDFISTANKLGLKINAI